MTTDGGFQMSEPYPNTQYGIASAVLIGGSLIEEVGDAVMVSCYLSNRLQGCETLLMYSIPCNS